MKKYKSLKVKKAELRAILNYKKERKEFDSEYYELITDYMDLFDEIELTNFIEYIVSLFKGA